MKFGGNNEADAGQNRGQSRDGDWPFEHRWFGNLCKKLGSQGEPDETSYPGIAGWVEMTCEVGGRVFRPLR